MQVDNHISPPKPRNWKADLDKMQVNQSARIHNRYYNSVKAAISNHYHNTRQKTFTTAKQGDGYFRVWRVR
jgi:hypothetical protein